ncbi:MAG: carboxypeptidase regulatory-like domain-containing protein [Gemmatimonadota bacterium]|jgi:hypothetical protein
MHAIRAHGAAVVAALVLVTASPVWAQNVRGRYVAERTGQPLGGAFVTLLDGSGGTVASTLTNAGGWFQLHAPAPGRYVVRAEHIGYTTEQAAVETGSGATVVVKLVGHFKAIELEGLTAEVDKACSIPASQARRVATLWDEVRKAFRVTAYVEREALYLFDVERWTRTLEPRRLRVEGEERRARTGMHPGSPFVSLPPQRLAAQGYIQESDDSDDLRYYAPDARVLLDPSFQASHCFALTLRGPEEGWVGLRFEPRDRRKADIEGTLWIDASTYEPRRLDYRYPVLPWDLVTDKVGGRIDFTRIPQGPWIVRRWWIRMPVVQEAPPQRTPWAELRTRYRLASLIEEGGEIRDVRANGREALAFDLGTVQGTVVDSATGAPLPGARVVLDGTYFTTETDADGHFSFTGVPEGRYRARVTTEALRTLGAAFQAVDVDVVSGSASSVSVRMPRDEEVARGLCGEGLSPDGEGTVTGRLRTERGGAPRSASIHVSWDVVTRFDASPGTDRSGRPASAVGFTQAHHEAEVPARPDGSFVACGLPLDEEVTFRAEAPGLMSKPATLRLTDATLRRVDLSLAPVTLAEALLVRVLQPDGRTPVEAAEVALPELGRSLSTDASGTAIFPEIPAGPVRVDIHHLAYVDRTDTVGVSPEGRTVEVAVLADQALELEPIVVEVLTPEALANLRSGSSATAAVSLTEIRELIREARVNNLADVVREKLHGAVRTGPIVRGPNYVGTCIEYTRAPGGSARRCDMVQVVVDGMYLTTNEAARLVESFPLLDIVSLEFLSPMEQTFRYGTQRATGMLIIHTSRGGG